VRMRTETMWDLWYRDEASVTGVVARVGNGEFAL
jgi:hypothetical protein